ncbi:MAG: hypothetical protein B6240_02470 [Desulfobacteraceae bacterium 4572_87]|nr:MAG: hypothetical protein B6240_02470 [Desulfobacteraceae bacterium 4572_87]
MKCPKCNYTSFDFNRACPKCGNDNTEEQTRLNLSSNKPNPPFFLASLMGTEGSLNLEIPTDGAPIPSSGAASEEMDTQDLLIALDGLQSDNAKPDFQEPLGPSTDELVFDTDDSKEETLEPLEPFDPEENEILFDLEPASEEDEIESISIDPLDKKGFSDFEAPDEKPGAVEAVEIQDETEHIIDETDIFLADDAVTLEDPTEKTAPAIMDDTLEEPDSQELFLSLDDLPGDETQSDTSEPTRVDKSEIVFELGEAPEQGEQPALKDTPQALFLKETEDKTGELDLLPADETTEPEPFLDEKAPTNMKNRPDDSQDLFLSLDDLPGDKTKSDPSASTRIEDDDNTFELEEALKQEETSIEKEAPGEKGFWDSEEIEKQVAAFELEENGTKTMDAYPKKTTDEKMGGNLFSDLDIEPLDLEFLDDVEKKS